MLLIYNNPAFYEAWSEEDRTALFSEVDQIMTELRESGEFVAGEALADGSNTKTVRVRDGVPAVTDGPFAEAKETISYALYQVRSKDEAVEWASRFVKLHRDLWEGWEGEADVLKVFGPEDFGGPA
jgi:hypothetical protein